MEQKIKVLDDIGFVSLVDRMQNDISLKVVNSARISYAKKKSEFNEADKKLSNFLWNSEHSSPFRHSYYTFHLKLPLFVCRQHIKYQVGSCFRTYEVNGEEISGELFDHFFDTDKGCSWNEISGRYAELKPEFYIPKVFRSNAGHANKQKSSDLPQDFPHKAWEEQFRDHFQDCYVQYEFALKNGIAKEMARTLLPQSIYTEAYWTVSLQGLMHFLEQRLKSDAQFEIREYAKAIYSLVKDDLDKLGISFE
jgi:thymidylate synthase (FAD)